MSILPPLSSLLSLSFLTFYFSFPLFLSLPPFLPLFPYILTFHPLSFPPSLSLFTSLPPSLSLPSTFYPSLHFFPYLPSSLSFLTSLPSLPLPLHPPPSHPLSSHPHLLQELLDKNKWCRILLEFGSFPERYRPVIWVSVLEVPRNYSVFSTLLDKGTHSAYQHLGETLQLADAGLFKALQR